MERSAVIRDLQKKSRGVEKKRVSGNGDREDSGRNVFPQPASAKQCIPAEESIQVTESSGSKAFTANKVGPVIKTKASVITFKKLDSRKAEISTLMKESVAEGKCFYDLLSLLDIHSCTCSGYYQWKSSDELLGVKKWIRFKKF